MELLFRGFHESELGKEQIQLDGKVVTGMWVKGFYLDGYICGTLAVDDDENFVPYFWLSVKEETVSQCIGITDRGDKKIFIGDILEGKNGRHTVVESRNGWRLVDEKGRTHTMAYIKFYEIVSNIFEVEQ